MVNKHQEKVLGKLITGKKKKGAGHSEVTSPFDVWHEIKRHIFKFYSDVFSYASIVYQEIKVKHVNNYAAGWITTNFYPDIYDPQKMDPADFSDSQVFTQCNISGSAVHCTNINGAQIQTMLCIWYKIIL